MQVPSSYIPPNAMLHRRQFLHTATGAATAGITSILGSKTPPAYAAERTLTILSQSHFIPASDDTLRQMAQQFEKANRCRVNIEFIPHRDTYIKVAKEQQTRYGHDIVFLFFSLPHLYYEELETLDFMEALGNRLGGWYDFAREVGQVQGRWVALPWFCTAMPMTYREDLYRQHNFLPPQTWEDWKETGKKIKAASGHKVGVALNQTEDSNLTLYAILWSYGASTANAEGRVSINAPETRQAMDYVKDLYEACMTNDVLVWDDASNNQAFLSGEYSWVHNATSIYGAAKQKAPKIFEVTNHTLTPSGPGGQHGTAIPNNYGIWRFAKEKTLAKEFLQFIMDVKRLEANFHATSTFNAPIFKAGERFDWQRDPKTAVLKDYMKTAHMIGWPAPPDHRAEQARAQWIVPDMFTAYATGKQTLEEAVLWGETRLQRLYKA